MAGTTRRANASASYAPTSSKCSRTFKRQRAAHRERLRDRVSKKLSIVRASLQIILNRYAAEWNQEIKVSLNKASSKANSKVSSKTVSSKTVSNKVANNKTAGSKDNRDSRIKLASSKERLDSKRLKVALGASLKASRVSR